MISKIGLCCAAGALLIFTGTFVSSSTLAGFLRETPGDAVLLGAALFKTGFVILGLLIFILCRIPIWNFNSKRETPYPEPQRKSSLAALAILLAAASAVRLYDLNSGLWFDEIVTYVNFVQVPFGEIISTYSDQNQHILYSLLAHASFLLFGEGNWSLRLPAVLFGIGSIWALYLLGRQVAGTREAFLAAALLAFSYHHVWFSQNARGYTGLLFWTILASWLFLRGLREGRPELWLLYAASAALGAYTLIYMVFVVIGHFAIYLMILLTQPKEIGPNRWSGLFLGFCLAGLLTFQLHALVLPQFLRAFAEAQVGGRVWTQPLWALLEFVRGMQTNFSGSVVAIAALSVFGIGLWSFARTNPVVIQLFIIPLLICATVKWGMGHHLWPRSFFFAAGFGVLVIIRGTMLLGHAAGRLLNFSSGKSALVGTTLCIGFILASATSIPLAYGPKQDYLGALTFVEAEKEPRDAVVTVGLATFPYKNFYKLDWEPVENLEALESIRSRSRRTWLLYTLPIQLQDLYPDLTTVIQRDFKVVRQFYGTLGEGTIFVCRSDTPPSA